MVEFDECEAAQLFFDVVESVGVQKAAHQQPNPHAFFELDVKWNLEDLGEFSKGLILFA